MILTIPCLPIHGVHTSDELPAFSLELFNHFFHIDYAPFPTVVSLRVFLLLLKRMVIQDSRQGFVFLSDRRAVNFHSGTHLSDEYCFIMFPAPVKFKLYNMMAFFKALVINKHSVKKSMLMESFFEKYTPYILSG